ncbi:MAG: class I SAM-dependent methyltransferase [Devosia sp.]
MTVVFDPRRLLSNTSMYRALQARIRRADTSRRVTEEVLRIQRGQRVLDIGCGPADILGHLPESVQYYGFDAEPNYIQAATERYGSRGTFVAGTVSPGTMDGLGTFDVIMSLAVLHHLSDEDANIMFSAAATLLGPGGRFVTLDCAFVPGQHPVARMLAAMDRGKYVRSPDAYAALARPHFSEVSVTLRHDLLAVPYSHCIMELGQPVR